MTQDALFPGEVRIENTDENWRKNCNAAAELVKNAKDGFILLVVNEKGGVQTISFRSRGAFMRGLALVAETKDLLMKAFENQLKSAFQNEEGNRKEAS